MIKVECDHCGKSAPLHSVPRTWMLLNRGERDHHFCTIDCLLFWGAKLEERTG